MTLRQLCEPVCDYAGLIAALRLRIQEVGASCESIDHLTGLASGHTTKIIAPRRIRIAGKVSLGLLLDALNLRLIPVVDDAAAEQYRSRLPPTKIRRWHRQMDWGEVNAVAAGRDLQINVNQLGDPATIEAAAANGAAVLLKPAPPSSSAPSSTAGSASKPARPAFNPAESHHLPIRSRPMFGRGQRKASRPGASAAA
jgi:hypothetical protein